MSRNSRNRRSLSAFNVWMRKNRAQLGISQIALATRLDLSQATISNLESGYTQWPMYDAYGKIKNMFPTAPDLPEDAHMRVPQSVADVSKLSVMVELIAIRDMLDELIKKMK